MSGLQLNSITGAGSAAESSIASALATKKHMSSSVTSSTSAPKDTAPTTPATSSTDSSGDITSSDFLTLLVSELKNQDPTQPTDPNAYITQLVGVNSLQQLISINQDLTPTGTSSTQSTTDIKAGLVSNS
jgi:flagellar basal-body rod modification protein FlgD